VRRARLPPTSRHPSFVPDGFYSLSTLQAFSRFSSSRFPNTLDSKARFIMAHPLHSLVQHHIPNPVRFTLSTRETSQTEDPSLMAPSFPIPLPFLFFSILYPPHPSPFFFLVGYEGVSPSFSWPLRLDFGRSDALEP